MFFFIFGGIILGDQVIRIARLFFLGIVGM